FKSLSINHFLDVASWHHPCFGGMSKGRQPMRKTFVQVLDESAPEIVDALLTRAERSREFAPYASRAVRTELNQIARRAFRTAVGIVAGRQVRARQNAAAAA